MSLPQGYHFLGPYRSNPFERKVIFVYEIRSYVDISVITQRLLPIKQTDDQCFSKEFIIYIPTLVKRVLS